MNLEKLKTSEEAFLEKYPGGFQHPKLLEISKKHHVEKMIKLTTEAFSIESFDDPNLVTLSFKKIISQSSLVSVFEKAKFRDVFLEMSAPEKLHLFAGLRNFFHGDQRMGFNMMVDVLSTYKLAKWPILTVSGVYYHPDIEVLIKPTTAKGVIEYFELDDIKYNSKPSYEFYIGYREKINELKSHVGKSLQIDNAAFCGFLMMAMEDGYHIK